MTKLREPHREWSKNPDYETAYEALAEEFHLAAAMIEARTRAGLSQAQLAKRMKTSQSFVARIEVGGVRPSTKTLERIARATGSRLKITFEPLQA